MRRIGPAPLRLIGTGSFLRMEDKPSARMLSEMCSSFQKWEMAFTIARKGFGNPSIGLAFQYCDGTRQLWMVSTNDETEVSFVASKVENGRVGRVTKFQSTTWETGVRNPSDPASVGFGIYDRTD